jgi:hypothetical protein
LRCSYGGGATDLVLGPFQTEPSELTRMWSVAAELCAYFPNNYTDPANQPDVKANLEGTP